jgi:hypothetical protein
MTVLSVGYRSGKWTTFCDDSHFITAIS